MLLVEPVETFLLISRYMTSSDWARRGPWHDARMARDRILAIIQAGGAGGRMDVLTRERAKPALPFAGIYQLVDFPLSNLAHSGIRDVWLSVSYLGSTLEDEVSNGRPWDLDRNQGGLRLLMPQEGTGSTDEEGFARGNADELYRIRDKIAAADPEVVVVMSADHVYRFDYLDAVGTHRDADADCTVVTTEVPLDEASDHATVSVDDSGAVVGFAYKPEDPETTTVATEIFVYSPGVLVETLEQLHRELGPASGPGDSGLGDFGEHLLPRLVDTRRVVAHRLPGYWKDLGEPHKYLAAHRDLLTDNLGVLRRPELADSHSADAARACAGPGRRDGHRQPVESGQPRVGHRASQRARPGGRGAGRGRRPRQRGLRGHRRRARRQHRLGRGRPRVRRRGGRPGRRGPR